MLAPPDVRSPPAGSCGGDGIIDDKRAQGQNTGVHHLLVVEWIRLHGRVIAAQEPRSAANAHRPKPGARSIARARVEWKTKHSHIESGHLIETRQPSKRRRAHKPRKVATVRRPDVAS